VQETESANTEAADMKNNNNNSSTQACPMSITLSDIEKSEAGCVDAFGKVARELDGKEGKRLADNVKLHRS
jgi:hypothetical protein